MGDELRFDDRVVIVTDAGGGLGSEHAKALGRRGASVVVNDVVESRAQRVVDEIRSQGGNAAISIRDVSQSAGADALIADAFEKFGALDAVLNNAGRGGPTGPLDTINDETIATIINTHLVGTINVTRAAWPYLAASGRGRVLVTASGSSFGAAGMPIYSTAKAGLLGFARSMAIEGEAMGININALLPIGYTRAAAMNPDRNVREWMEHAFPAHLVTPAALWLLHETCPVTGEWITTGAGRVARVGAVSIPGLQSGDSLTPEMVRDCWGEITDLSDSVPIGRARDDMALFEGAAAWAGPMR